MSKEVTSPLLLDTHVWIWLINGDQRLATSPALRLIHQAASRAEVFVSVISMWEVGMLEAKKRIVLPLDGLEWVRQALKAPGVSLAALTPEIALESSRLPGQFHGDPADRILVATARNLQAALVTQDHWILQYAQKRFLTAIPT